METVQDLLKDDHGLAEVIYQEKVDSLYRVLASSIFANIVIASIMALVLWRISDSKVLIIWLVSMVAINLIRLLLSNLYEKNQNTRANITLWERAFYVLLVLNAVGWSSVSIWLLPDTESVYHFYPALIIVGISAGAVNTLSFSMKHIITYLTLLLLPLFIVELLIGTFISYSVSGLIVVLALFAYSNAKQLNNTITENIKLNYESKKYTEKLIETRNEALEANSEKTNFVSMISHELRTPLNAILGFGQLLKFSDEPELNKEQSENVDGIIHSGRHLLSLIEELLDLSKIESRKLKVDIDDVSLTYILVESVSLLNPVAHEYNIDIINNVDINNIHLVKADTKRLKQVLINLISNAIKYNHENGEVTIEVNDIDKKKVRVSVTDTGDGLTKEQCDGLFVPFKRYDNKREGIGLGLYITHNLVKLMHGDIGVESEVGKGSTFWFEIPLAH
jgi:signal transduction histidine kinase